MYRPSQPNYNGKTAQSIEEKANSPAEPSRWEKRKPKELTIDLAIDTLSNPPKIQRMDWNGK